MRKAKIEEIPEVSVLLRIHTIVLKCKSAAFELAKHLQDSKFKCFASWIHITNKGLPNGKYIEQRKTLIMILEALFKVF